MADADQTPESTPPAPQRFSLERLSSAFARLMGSNAGGAAAKRPQITVDAGQGDADFDLDDQPIAVTPRMIVEGLLFVGRADGRPLTTRELAAPIRNVEPEEVDEIVDSLNAAYRQDASPYEIVAEAGGRRLHLSTDAADVRERMRGQVRSAKLTPSALEVLALVAYQQPVTGQDIDAARGVRSQPILAQLVRRSLLRIDRPAKGSGPAKYHTTARFNELFGVKSAAELPQNEDLDDS